MTATTLNNDLTKLMRSKLQDDRLTINSLYQVRLDNNRLVGQMLVGIDDVTEHLRTLAVDNDCEWEGVDASELYNPEQCRQWHDGLRYWGAEVWFQLY